jgi:hypothetical protein
MRAISRISHESHRSLLVHHYHCLVTPVVTRPIIIQLPQDSCRSLFLAPTHFSQHSLLKYYVKGQPLSEASSVSASQIVFGLQQSPLLFALFVGS